MAIIPLSFEVQVESENEKIASKDGWFQVNECEVGGLARARDAQIEDSREEIPSVANSTTEPSNLFRRG